MSQMVEIKDLRRLSVSGVRKRIHHATQNVHDVGHKGIALSQMFVDLDARRRLAVHELERLPDEREGHRRGRQRDGFLARSGRQRRRRRRRIGDKSFIMCTPLEMLHLEMSACTRERHMRSSNA